MVELSDVTAGAASGSASFSPVTVAASLLSDLVNGAPYVNVLVKVGPVSAGALGAHNQIVLTGSDSGTLTMDDDADYGYGLGSALGSATAPTGCLMITGVVELNTSDNIHTINPRGSADIATTTGCP